MICTKLVLHCQTAGLNGSTVLLSRKLTGQNRWVHRYVELFRGDEALSWSRCVLVVSNSSKANTLWPRWKQISSSSPAFITFAILIIFLAISMSPWWFWPISAMMKHGWFPPTILPGHSSNFSGILSTETGSNEMNGGGSFLSGGGAALLCGWRRRPEPLACCTSGKGIDFRFGVLT